MPSPAYEVGDTVVYETIMGRLRTCCVTGKLDDVEGTGEPGFDAVESHTGDGVWGYDSQIVEVRS